MTRVISSLLLGTLVLALTIAAAAQDGAIAFTFGCNNSGGPYIMRADGTGKVALPIPPPLPAPPPNTGTRQLGTQPTDVSTIGPLTVLTLGGYVIEVDDVNGVLTPQEPISLLQPPAVAYTYAVFSPTSDRVALWSDGSNADFPMGITIADLVRDSTSKIIGMSNGTYISVANIGSPADSNASNNTKGFNFTWTGELDFSPDGTKLLFTRYSDLWLLSLANDGHTLVSATNLTRTVGSTERNPAFSPDGTKIAYMGGINTYSSTFGGYALMLSDQNIFTLDLTQPTYPTKLLTTNKNKGGSGDGRDSPAWSRLGTEIVFSAQGRSPGRGSVCGGINNDLFKIRADGSAPAVNLTNTVGTGSENISRWGW